MKEFKCLSILHYIWGGLYVFIVLAGGISFVQDDPAQIADYRENLRLSLCTAEPFKGDNCDTWITIFPIIIFAFILVFGALNLVSGWLYQRSRPNTINWVAASLNLISIPVGTVIGIYSLVRLSQYLKALRNDQFKNTTT